MGKQQDPAVPVIKGGLKRAWQDLRKANPTERVYAFGVYTTEGAEFLVPFACGEEGLERVAKRYVKKGVLYKSVADGVNGLRWSIPDSPYERFFSKSKYALDTPFDGQPNPLDLPETKMAREIHRRLTAAADALKALDAEGLFGKGKAREAIVLLIEAGDREEDFVLKWAKKLNPAKVYDAYAKIGVEPDTIGSYTEFGTKKVYRTARLSTSADRSLIAAATDDLFFVFQARPLKQLAGRAVSKELRDSTITDVSLSADGKLLAVHADVAHDKPGHLAWVTGPAWTEQTVVKLPSRGMSMVMDPAGRWAAVGDEKGRVQIHARDGGKPNLLKAQKDWVRGVAVSADGRTLVSSDGSTLVVWDVAKWKPRKQWRDEGSVVDVSPDGTRIVSTDAFGGTDVPEQGDRKTIARVYDARTGKVVKDIEVPGFSIARAVFSPNGKQLALGVQPFGNDEMRFPDYEAMLVDVASGAVLARLKDDFESVDDFAFLPDRNEIAVAIFGHTMRPLVLWKLPEGVRID